jgi:hypothetical protein
MGMSDLVAYKKGAGLVLFVELPDYPDRLQWFLEQVLKESD